MTLALAALGLLHDTSAQTPANRTGAETLSTVTVTAKANQDPVEKSYRKMVRGMDWFDSHRAMSPNGALRFKLLPRRRETDMNLVSIDVIANKVDFAVPIAPDHTFTLPRNREALAQDAQLTPDRVSGSMTWRTEVRTPGLPPNTRRLGDLRLECQVGMEAGLVSDSRSFVGKFASALMDTPSYCDKPAPKYLFFADKPVFSVTLVDGARREVLPLDKLYAAASTDDGRREDLSYCDCELLRDRTYYLPLGDRSWPDDTLVEFVDMEGP